MEKCCLNEIGLVFNMSWADVRYDSINVYAYKLAGCCGLSSFYNRRDLLDGFIENICKKVGYLNKDLIEWDFSKANKIEWNEETKKNTLEWNKNSKADFLRWCERDSSRILQYQKDRCFTVSEDPVLDIGGFLVFIGGRCDVGEDGGLVFRRKRYKKFIGLKNEESIQVHAYMFINCVDKIKFIETNGDGDVREEYILFDVKFWDDVKIRLEGFLNEVLSGCEGWGGWVENCNEVRVKEVV